MQNHRLLFLILAAVCYTVPFIFPESFFLLIFLFPSFLFLALIIPGLKSSLFTWSLIVMSIHLLPICDALLYMTTEHPIYVRIIPLCILICYGACILFIWLFTFQALLRHIHYYFSLSTLLFAWTCLVWAYFLFCDTMILWIFGQKEGYIFINPLIPLTITPSIRTLFSLLPYQYCLFWFCAVSTCITLFFLKKDTKSFFALSILSIPFLLSIPYKKISRIRIEALETIGHLPLIIPGSLSLVNAHAFLIHEIGLIKKQHPMLTSLIMPESSWNGTALSNTFTLPLRTSVITHLFIGSFALHNGVYTNRLYYFKNNTLEYHFDKRHAVPVTERSVPWIESINHMLFFKKSPPITPVKNPRNPIFLPPIGLIIPYICSELFCNLLADDMHPQLPILALVNDWWFRLPHFPKLMILAARFQAIRWGRPILYISFYYAQVFDLHSKSHALPTTPPDRFML